VNRKINFAHAGRLLAVYLCITALASGAVAGSTPINFTLDEPCVTSAGVFLTNGTLIRTLWSKIRFYAAGNYSTNWDGLDDYGNAVRPDVYEFKLLQHNVEYIWDGALGNTSAQPSGPTVYQGFYAMQDMAIAGSNAFFVSGYNEGKYAFGSFSTASSQYVANLWYWDVNQFGKVVNEAGSWCRSWIYAATDGNWVYFACPATYNPTNLNEYGYLGCVVACNVTNESQAFFTKGTVITNGPGDAIPNGIYVGSNSGLNGLSVQQNGNLLAAAVAPDNAVYLMDKHSGSIITKFSVNTPGRLSFSPDGSLWVIAGDSVLQYTNLPANPAVALTISGLSQPLDVAVNPTNPGVILVADGGGSQQIKAFDSTGASLWIYGLPGGYPANGVAVATNKFWFSYEGVAQTFLCFAPDDSFWVGDEENHRALHFSAQRNYLEQIMYQPHSYRTAVDQNNPSRVFNQFLEFNVDYTKPLSQPGAWTLVNNWKVNVPANDINSSAEGLYQVIDFPNGRTYALVDNTSFGANRSELCELTTNELRITGLFPLYSNGLGWTSFGPDGSLYQTMYNSATWYQAILNGFDESNNPQWNAPDLLASAPNGSTNPVPRCCSGNIFPAISTNGIIISYDSTLNKGSHFGGVQMGATNWLWQAGPPDNLNGCGNYEISNGLNYAGNTVYAVDRNVYFGYHGENFRGQAEAAQHFHFFDDGLFVSQFGESNLGHSVNEGALPGFAGNGYNPVFFKGTNGEYYLWVNDESDHGPQRWHLANARNIREQTAVGTLDSTIILSNQPCGFPVGLAATLASKSVQLTWQPVTGASAYNIRYSTVNGGPYGIFSGSTTNTHFFAAGLTNGQVYYFAVSAIVAGIEGFPSEQIKIVPFDLTQTVLPWGSMAEGGQSTPVDDINPGAVAANLPSLMDSEHATGNLTPQDLVDCGFGNLGSTTIGSQGYVLYDWGGPGINLTNLSPFYAITLGSGWTDCPYLERQFMVGNLLGTNYGIMANPVGTINILVNDGSFHILTVICPSKFCDSRSFTLTLTSVNGASVQFPVSETYGYNHTFQFLFTGNVTLTANATGGNEAIVQALFLDGVASVVNHPEPPQNPRVGP
jgi:hypothetical protein